MKLGKTKNAPGIYVIRCTANDKVYVGKSVMVRRRMSIHRSLLRNSKHPNKHLQRAWASYGEESFAIEHVDYVPEAMLSQMEIETIEQYHALDDTYGFNIQIPDGSSHRCAEETKQKLSDAHSGRTITPEWRERISQSTTGVKKSKEHKARISQSLKGKPQPHSVGSNNKRAKLCEASVLEILRKQRHGVSTETLVSEYGVSAVTIRGIARGVKWAHVPREVN